MDAFPVVSYGQFTEQRMLRELATELDINVKNAEEIGIEAFAHSMIERIEWPTKFQRIPKACFYLSELKSIINLKM